MVGWAEAKILELEIRAGVGNVRNQPILHA
jgi:hypothetical protein